MKTKREYLQSAMFGFNDALVSTTGVVVGVSTGTNNKSVVVLAGLVTIFVEAMSMGAGQYLSSKSAHQMANNRQFRTSLTSGVIMFIAYFAAGLVPLLAIILYPLKYSRQVAIIAALIGLFVLGYYKGKIVKVSKWRSALEVVIIGGVTTAVGLIIGHIFAI